LGLGVRVASSAAVAYLACSPVPTRHVATAERAPTEPFSVEPAANAPAAPREWPAKARLFLMTNERAELELRAAGSDFTYPLASNARHVLHDPALELAWLSDDQTLSVIDLREPAPDTVAPVVIASKLPPHVEIHVERGGQHMGPEGPASVEPVDACDLAPILVLHWEPEPWIESDQGQRSTELEGRAWLARESGRVARPAGEERWLHPSDAHVALSPDRARCEEAEWCGASQPFAASGWELVLAEQSQGADCWQFGCLLREPRSGAFGTPPQPSRWGPAEDMPSGPCGPYRFDAPGTAFLVNALLCAVGGSCAELGGAAIGWLTPGVTSGAPG
jgi:hypothetical protein